MSLFFIISCSNSPIEDGSKKDRVKLLLFYEEYIGNETAKITWSCSEDVKGILGYGENSIDMFLSSLYPSRNHSMTITGLLPNKRYMYITYCGGIGKANSGTRAFTTNIIDNSSIVVSDETKYAEVQAAASAAAAAAAAEAAAAKAKAEAEAAAKAKADFLLKKKRGIWIVGGIGNTNNLPESAVDFFDPVEGIWYNSITALPTPRAFTITVSYKGNIYVIGGLEVSGSVFVASDKTEMYNIETEKWTTLNSAPRKLVGAVGGVSGTNIYIVAGTTSTDMINSTVLNKVYKFSPDIGTGGTWTELTSHETIQPHIDMGGCIINGALYFTGGRYYTSGQEKASTDVYSPGSNSTTVTTEASLNQARHGVGYACYNPLPTDPYPSDAPALFIAGGSTLLNTAIPASTISISNRFEYYQASSSTNTFQTGSNLPYSLYYPAMAVSYTNRTLYLFGGASSINVPTNLILSLNLENPVSTSWTNTNSPMPRARYGHSAVIVDR